MTAELPEHEPRWLWRSEDVQPFVVTICTAGRISEALRALDVAAANLKLGQPERLAPNACHATVDCKPVEAWTLLRVLRTALSDADICLQPQKEYGKRLLICDMDMTIVAAETLDEVALQLGMGDQIAAITTRAMQGEIDFNDALCERIAMLAGQAEQVFHDVAGQLRFNSGAGALLAAARAAGVHTVLVSGGFAQVAEPVAERLGFDEVHCNHLQIDSGKLTGKVLDPIINADLKCQVLQQSAQGQGLALADCCAIGDGANDLPMLAAAGLGIAFYAKPVLRAATSCHIDATDLESAIHFMGLESADSFG